MESLLIVAVKSVVVVVALLTVFAYVMLFERKFLGFFQFRLGPNRTGPWGLMQPVADAVKLILKEDIIPEDADRPIYHLAPIVSLFVALAAFAVVPVAPPIELFGRTIELSILNPNAGVLVLLATTSLGVYGLTLGGWASQSKYALLGSLRSTAQMISYELSLGMSLVGVILLAGSLNLYDIVEAQRPLWFVVLNPIGFVVFFISAIAELNRVPFDLPEAETELVSGYHTEYSGIRMAMFIMAEYINMITMSSLVTLLYLGGWNGPLLPPFVWFALKVAVLIFIFYWMRATLPRLRYDRLMNFGWKVMLPLAVLNLVGTAIAVALL
mgnify:CR=1 FL=1